MPNWLLVCVSVYWKFRLVVCENVTCKIKTMMSIVHVHLNICVRIEITQNAHYMYIVQQSLLGYCMSLTEFE